MNKVLGAWCLVLGVGVSTAFAAGKNARELFVKPGSAKGFVAVVNQQTKVAEKEFSEAAECIRNDKAFVFKFVKDDAGAKGAAVVIRLVDEAGKPPMTVSPEVGRAEMYVAALVEDLPSEAGKKKFLIPRARREFLRTVAYAFGAGSSQFPGNIMAAYKLRDLDFCAELLPVDAIDTIVKNAKKAGLEPEYRVPYRTACEEGWAPAPTNDAQKAVWKEVCTVPDQPMKIEFKKNK